MKSYDLSRIQEIFNGSLIYTAELGRFRSSDLNACTKQYAQEYEARAGKPYPADECRCVGDHHCPMYFEIYTSPEHIRFTIDLQPLSKWKIVVARLVGWNFYHKEHAVFHQIQMQIVRAGYSTFDLT